VQVFVFYSILNRTFDKWKYGDDLLTTNVKQMFIWQNNSDTNILPNDMLEYATPLCFDKLILTVVWNTNNFCKLPKFLVGEHSWPNFNHGSQILESWHGCYSLCYMYYQHFFLVFTAQESLILDGCIVILCKFSVKHFRLVSELIHNYVFHCISLHWVSDFLAVLLNHLRLLF